MSNGARGKDSDAATGRRKLAVLSISVIAATLTAVTLAHAATNQVDGTQHFVGFGAEAIVYEMHGDLVGDWLTPYESFACKEQPKTVQCWGEETFDGFLDLNGNGSLDSGEPNGTLAFTFKFSGSASGNGRCHHPIVDGSGTGGFANATGQLTFKDRLGACGELNTTYSGHISIP